MGLCHGENLPENDDDDLCHADLGGAYDDDLCGALWSSCCGHQQCHYDICCLPWARGDIKYHAIALKL